MIRSQGQRGQVLEEQPGGTVNKLIGHFALLLARNPLGNEVGDGEIGGAYLCYSAVTTLPVFDLISAELCPACNSSLVVLKTLQISSNT